MGKSTNKTPVKSSLFEKLLRRRVQETYGSSTPPIDDLIDSLRAKYPEYGRHKSQLFTRMVKQTLDYNNTNKDKRKSTRNDVEYDDDMTSPSPRSPVSKKVKKVDSREERLQLLEIEHVARRRVESADSDESDSSESSESEEDKSAVSTSDEDAVYSLKFEPEFDLTKSMLRNKYNTSKSNGKTKKNVELEVVTNSSSKENKKVDMVKEGRTSKLGRKSNDSGGSGMDDGGNGKDDGPRFKDLGGMDGVLDELKMEVIVPLYHPELPRRLGVRPMSGILLHGPPGCGKTKLAHAIANETGVPFYKISATELVSGISGASEENIRDLFSKAYRTAPSIVFIDEIDAIASKRENLQREMERRIVTQLMTCMDESHRVSKPDGTSKNTETPNDKPGYVLVIGATNRPDAVDPALRRPGRFDREISLGVPDENARIKILTVLTRSLKLEGAFDLVKISRATPGFVGADLAALVNKAGNLAMKRIIDGRKLELSTESTDAEQNEDWWRKGWTPEEMDKLSITMSDFEVAAKMVQPSSRREGFSSIPNVKWGDVGGLDLLRREFDRYIVRRIKYPNEYEEYGVDLETGFLLYGPPGCGKTLIAKAVANEAGANFIHIKGPELLNKYVGESELAVRTIFSRARTCSPCILFFDEVDALTTKRGREGGWVVERLLNQLLIELDGADQRKGVYIIGATNRPEVMDQAVLRPGRFGKLMYVPLPNQDERGLILKALSRNKPLDDDVDLIAVARSEACANLSGADLSALMNEAAMAAVEEKFSRIEAASNEGTSSESYVGGMPHTIKAVHFQQALEKISPSVSDKQKQYYQRLSESFKAS
ncbi:putative AAA+ ATPase domain, ATPase, AAA-type, core, NVL2, nucleolin binding protein [Helianthus annuus]|uniref:AAA+ ATPase domain, ATPase, AAA-type, core, NVL2, nucleolin binding protein n=1 Tax=Helianthus annuus TaxID=4232 RepID=A0A251UQA3_HELAN|nr:cell division control protein 48 homolog C [Helianthus annuus]KAF5756764.1 putative AAA+ ATPase domain, ATPase, AAA-type, core, NVL2, nucleolin binding protein [Helianthus annuus]KAJ0435023.1 putative AAA+ ATPase domain, ATPase, AAA-type, core, NVL2, nucleolin binding protein [Helianthus annuus]KAJ0633522.1 putative AAA+ ATPase domain, ATPase, AAA-type, core, NVL2, nucleolin binding protein [Helianthus annuus]KAJ0814475.1 putative AAA+ ATPase domain, ATPase, AAA-type, core, NVL2, nucleolin b